MALLLAAGLSLPGCGTLKERVLERREALAPRALDLRLGGAVPVQSIDSLIYRQFNYHTMMALPT